jgi:hypothetical protein
MPCVQELRRYNLLHTVTALLLKVRANTESILDVRKLVLSTRNKFTA